MNTTKGPWIVRGDILEATVEHTDGENRSIIARCYGMSLCDEHGGDALSNALFIAESCNVARLQRIEAAALAIDGIEMSNCVEIPLSAWEDLQAALYGEAKP